MAAGLTAVVTGGTGAIGRELVAELLRSDAWSRVVLISRTRLPPSTMPAESALRAAKLDEHVVDTSSYAPHAALFRGDAHFCIVGAPRHSVPTPAEYERVNKSLPLECARFDGNPRGPAQQDELLSY